MRSCQRQVEAQEPKQLHARAHKWPRDRADNQLLYVRVTLGVFDVVDAALSAVVGDASGVDDDDASGPCFAFCGPC